MKKIQFHLVKAIRHMILSLFLLLLVVGGMFAVQLFQPEPVSAQATCQYTGQCVNNRRCLYPGSQPNGEECGSALIGGVEPPGAIAAINRSSGGNVGVIFFFSRAIHGVNIIAGILVMLNFVGAGFMYIAGAGNASSMAKINERLTWSVIGILVIVGSYTLVAVFGLVFYNDPSYVLNPKFTSALDI